MGESGRRELVDASTYLRSLLNGHDRYRARWFQFAERRGGEPNIGAVSRVIVEHLWTYEHELDPKEFRSLKDRVRRALNSQVLTPETLHMFTDAFDMEVAHRTKLDDLLANPPALRSREIAPPDPDWTYETLSLQELHFIGADGLPAKHRTIHTIQALTDGVQSHYYVFDTSDVEVQATRGATSGPIEPSDKHRGFWQCRFDFDRPLAAGAVRTFEYDTVFNYTEAPRREMRRGARTSPLSALSMVVEFDPSKLPTSIHEAEWEHSEDVKPTALVPTSLDGYRTAHYFVSQLREKVVGLTWEW